MSKKRRGRVYAGRGKCYKVKVRRLVRKRRSGGRGCGRRFARPFGGALAPLGSPPGRLPLSNYSGAEFLPRLFFSNSRPQNQGAARGLLPPRKGAPGGRAFLRPPGRKSGEQKAARQGVRWTRKAMWAVGQRFCCSFFVPTMSTYLLCAQFRRRGVKVWTVRLFLVWAARRFGGALAPLGSPPGRLPLSNYSGAEFCRACFF